MPKRINENEESKESSNSCLIIDEDADHSAEKIKKLENRMTKFPLKFTTDAGTSSARRIDTTKIVVDSQQPEGDEETKSLPDCSAYDNGEKPTDVVGCETSHQEKKKQMQGQGKTEKQKPRQQLIQGKQYPFFLPFL